MSIAHLSRNGDTYFLHAGVKKNGKPNYFFSRDKEGTLATTVPEGYEVYEDLRGQVHLRKRTPQIITPAELKLVTDALKKAPRSSFYRAEIKKNMIVIHDAECDLSLTKLLAPWMPEDQARATRLRLANFMPSMRFILVDEQKRVFETERYCYRGSVDDWISIGINSSDPLQTLVKRFVKHVGKESMFELY